MREWYNHNYAKHTGDKDKIKKKKPSAKLYQVVLIGRFTG